MTRNRGVLRSLAVSRWLALSPWTLDLDTADDSREVALVGIAAAPEPVMSNPAFETLSAESLATATGGLTSATSSDSTLRQSLRPILHSLQDLGTSSANSQISQKNQTMMMTMMMAMMARR